MRISTKGRYGLEAILYLAVKQEETEYINVKEIADATDISENYLEQLFIPLKQATVVQGFRGAQGGYRLKKKPDEISVAEILAVLEGDMAPVPMKEKSAEKNQIFADTIQGVWDKMADAVFSIIDNCTIEDLVDRYQKMDHILNYSI